MAENTQTSPPSNSPAAFGYCAWHKGHAEDIRLIQVEEQGSGPGGCLFACAPCRSAYRLVPLADR
jgi:hypothetical protein